MSPMDIISTPPIVPAAISIRCSICRDTSSRADIPRITRTAWSRTWPLSFYFLRWSLSRRSTSSASSKASAARLRQVAGRKAAAARHFSMGRGIGCRHGLPDLHDHRLRRIRQGLFPAAAERLEQRDEVERDIGGALRQLLFVLQQVALGIEHGQEVGDAVIVART